MKIVAGLGCIDDYPLFCEAGADEFFCGYVTWGMILYTADSLAEVDRYDERNWGGNAYEYALILCMDSVLAI